MATNQTERGIIAGWAEQVRAAATWVSGRNTKVLNELADQMDIAAGEDGFGGLEVIEEPPPEPVEDEPKE